MTHLRQICLIDDSMSDALLTQEALAHLEVSPELVHYSDAQDALASLLGKKGRELSVPPDLILLDLNMPSMSGKEFLAEIKKHENLRKIPVVILSNSDLPNDISDCYGLQAAGYTVKPVNFHEFVELAQALVDFWGRQNLFVD